MTYPMPEPTQAAQWLLSRKKLNAWARTVGFTPAAHHQLLIEKLEAVARGECKRLMVFMPPGSAKSTYGSVLFPAWFLNRCPSSCIIAASHTQELAEKFGRRVRNIVNEYGPVLGYSLALDSQAAGRWETDNDSEYFACGVGGSITGRRADLAIIDDPVKSREDAASETIREKQWEWFKFDLMTRLKPNARIVLIMTRWHEDDLAGRLIEEGGKDWDIVRLPMEAEENDPLGRKVGEPLWPEYFTDEQRVSAKSDVRVWTSLYQQRPVPESGGFFKRDWLRTYQPEELPKNLRIYFASDHAVSTKESADFTCIQPVGVDAGGVIWVLPVNFWERADSDVVVEAALKLVQLYKPLTWWAESGHISKSIGPFLRKRMLETNTFTTVDEVVPSKDKQTRAQSIRARMAMGMVRFPKVSWWTRAEAELLSFDGGKHDDFVDTLAHVGMGLDRISNAHNPVDTSITKGSFAWHSQGQQKPAATY